MHKVSASFNYSLSYLVSLWQKVSQRLNDMYLISKMPGILLYLQNYYIYD